MGMGGGHAGLPAGLVRGGSGSGEWRPRSIVEVSPAGTSWSTGACSRGGAQAVVLEGEDLGFGASTRNGGGVSGGTSLGKGVSGAGGSDALLRAMVGDAVESLTYMETVIEREGIACHYERTGRLYTEALRRARREARHLQGLRGCRRAA